MNPDNTIATVPQTSVWVCGTGPAQAAGGPPAHNTARGVCYTFPHGECMQPAAAAQPYPNSVATTCTQDGGCPPPAHTGGQPAGQQSYTLHGATLCTQVGGCTPPAVGGAQPQMSTFFTTCTQPIVCQPHHNISVPPHCPTVHPLCPAPGQAGGQAQGAAFTMPYPCHTLTGTTPIAGNQPQPQAYSVGPWCGIATVTAQAQGLPNTVDCPPAAQPHHNVSVPPHCPTVHPMCPPPAQAQNQQGGSFTQRPDQCLTGTTPAAGQPGQAQGLPETVLCQPATQHVVGCTTIAGYTHNPPMCPHVIHNPLTQHPYQCGTTITGALPVCRTEGPGQAQGVYETQYCGTQPAQAQGIYRTQYCGAQPAQAQGIYDTQICPAQAQAPAPSMFPPQCPTIWPHCGPGNAGGNQPQVAPTHLLGCTTATTPPVQHYTQAPGCNTATPTAHYTHNIPGCTTVTSPQAQGQGFGGWTSNTPCVGPPAQAQGTILPITTMCYPPSIGCPAPAGTIGNAQAAGGTLAHTYHPAGGCGPANAAGQAPAPPITNVQDCGPTWNRTVAGNAAQAQPQMTIPTFPPAVCVVTQLANCTKVTGIPFVC